MKIDNLKGNVTAINYQGWSELYSLHFNISRPVLGTQDYQRNSVLNNIHFSEITICKRSDPVSHHLLHHMCTHNSFSIIDIHACYTNTQLAPYVKYKLHNSFIRYMDTHISHGGEATELVSLCFTQIITSFISRDNNNQPLPPLITGYDIEQAEVM